MLRPCTLVVLLCCAGAPAWALDWPQWMGPGRDGVWREEGVLRQLPKAGPKVLWRVPIAGGYAGPAVAAGRVYVPDFVSPQGTGSNSPGGRDRLPGTERLLCLDAQTGRELWKHEYACEYNISYACGPRVTPTVEGGKVYSLGAEGNLLCLDAQTGQVVWQRDLNDDFQVETPFWGFCGHPLVDGNRLICLVGGEGSVVVAFDKNTGAELWRSLSASEPGYCPPSIVAAGGKRQLLIWHPEALNGLDPETGKLYWTYPLAPQYKMSVTAPQAQGNLVYTSGIGKVAAVIRLTSTGKGFEEVWKGSARSAVYCSNSTPLIDDGIVYGVDCDSGHLRAVKLETGERLWETLEPTTGERPTGHGTAFLVKNGDRYFLFNEKGELIIARLSAKGYEELSRAKLLEPTGLAFGRRVVWSHPAFANKCIFARNDKEIVCASLAAP